MPERSIPLPTVRATPLRTWFLANPRHGPLPALLLAMTVVTGFIDAVSLLGLGHVFVANMTGNVVFIALAIAQAPGYSLWGAVLALGGYSVGAAAAGAIILRRPPHRGRLLRNTLLIQVALITGCLGVALASSPTAGSVAISVMVLLAALGFGAQNATVRHLGVPDITTSVLTMTITGLAADIRRRDTIAVTRRLLSILTMLIGAFLSATLYLWAGLVPTLAVIVGMLVVMLAAAIMVSHAPAPWHYQQK